MPAHDRGHEGNSRLVKIQGTPPPLGDGREPDGDGSAGGRLIVDAAIAAAGGPRHEPEARDSAKHVREADPRIDAIADKIDQLSNALRESQSLYKQSRTRFHDFISATSDWVWETDENAVIVFISDRITEILGRPAAVLRGKNLFEIGAPVGNGGRDSVIEAIQSRRPFRDQPFELRDDQGKIRRCNLSGMPVFNDELGRFMGFRGTGTDVTAQFEAEEAVRHSQSKLQHLLEEVRNKNLHLEIALVQAEASTHAKTEFLANVSHELRTPLNAIIGFTELLQREMFGPLGDSRYKGYVTNVLDSGRHLLDIISDLLDMAKVEAGQLELRDEEVDIASTVASCTKLLSESARASGLTLAANLPRDLPLLRADQRMLKQMLLNLLSNAIKFTPEDGSVAVNGEMREDGKVSLSITDTGIGIAQHDIEKVLTPFGQVDSAFSRRHEGTGLGLPLVKAMIELHQGTLTLHSEIGVGTTATLAFPADRAIGAA
jgi:PAS domain S-box-containing protein